MNHDFHALAGTFWIVSRDPVGWQSEPFLSTHFLFICLFRNQGTMLLRPLLRLSARYGLARSGGRLPCRNGLPIQPRFLEDGDHDNGLDKSTTLE